MLPLPGGFSLIPASFPDQQFAGIHSEETWSQSLQIKSEQLF